MASIAFAKLHGGTEVSAMLRHSDAQERLNHNHKNKDIDKSRTHLNTALKKTNYADTMQYYIDYLARLDHRNRNKRKDRVTCFELCLPFPEVTPERWKDAERVLFRFLEQTFNDKNIINAYCHYDEVHDYYDHDSIKTSRPHIHAFIVPEIKGQLNGKQFSARSRMIALNKELDALVYEELGVHYLTHTSPRKKSVEELKQASYEALSNKLNHYKELDTIIKIHENNKEKAARIHQRIR